MYFYGYEQHQPHAFVNKLSANNKIMRAIFRRGMGQFSFPILNMVYTTHAVSPDHTLARPPPTPTPIHTCTVFSHTYHILYN